MISEFYGNRKTTRSGAFLMNHIHEGLWVLKQIGATENAMKAYCLHPLFQSDSDLKTTFETYDLSLFSSKVVAPALECRSVANEYLSKRKISSVEDIRLSPLKDVNDMLIADKVQNYKDFLKYHSKTHPRAKELDQYFRNWFLKFKIDFELLEALKSAFI